MIGQDFKRQSEKQKFRICLSYSEKPFGDVPKSLSDNGASMGMRVYLEP